MPAPRLFSILARLRPAVSNRAEPDLAWLAGDGDLRVAGSCLARTDGDDDAPSATAAEAEAVGGCLGDRPAPPLSAPATALQHA